MHMGTHHCSGDSRWLDNPFDVRQPCMSQNVLFFSQPLKGLRFWQRKLRVTALTVLRILFRFEYRNTITSPALHLHWMTLPTHVQLKARLPSHRLNYHECVLHGSHLQAFILLLILFLIYKTPEMNSSVWPSEPHLSSDAISNAMYIFRLNGPMWLTLLFFYSPHLNK